MMVVTNKALGRLSKRPDEPSPGADVGRTSPVPVQMWEGEPSPGADVGRTSPVPVRMWAGVSPVPVQMWEGEPSPGADVGGAPVMSVHGPKPALSRRLGK
jgi:hypothetical protein